MTEYQGCVLCPRQCNADRTKGQKGYCGMGDTVYAAAATLHYWEEPCISGEHGSGTLFFSGCNMRCIFCQNHSISRSETGKSVSCERLCEIFFELKEKGAHNINFVTPTHFLPHVRQSIVTAKVQGFDLPFVYNTSGYELPAQLRSLEGLVDIFLPDYKYALSRDAELYSNAPDYPERALAAIDEMVRQTGDAVIEKGIMKRGVIIRHLLLPGNVIASKIAVKRLYERYGDKVYLSLMSQYTPMPHMSRHPTLSRQVTAYEYKSLCEYALSLGVKNAYVQELGSVGESFIPIFDGRGI